MKHTLRLWQWAKGLLCRLWCSWLSLTWTQSSMTVRLCSTQLHFGLSSSACRCRCLCSWSDLCANKDSEREASLGKPLLVRETVKVSEWNLTQAHVLLCLNASSASTVVSETAVWPYVQLTEATLTCSKRQARSLRHRLLTDGFKCSHMCGAERGTEGQWDNIVRRKNRSGSGRERKKEKAKRYTVTWPWGETPQTSQTLHTLEHTCHH